MIQSDQSPKKSVQARHPAIRQSKMAKATGRSDFIGLILPLAVPDVVTQSPLDGASDAMIDANLILTFSEAVIADTGDIRIKKQSDDSIVATISIIDTGQVTFSGATVTINPSSNLAASTGYYVEIDAGAIENTTGGAFAGYTLATEWNFTTVAVDTDNPLLASLSPADDATSVAALTNLVMTFDEDVQAGTGNVTVKRVLDNALIHTIAITDGDRVTFSGRTCTINPDGQFASLDEFYVEVPATAIDDLACNAFSGIFTTAWTFTTADITPPQISTLNPVLGATGVAAAASMVLTFDETVSAGTGNVIIKEFGDDSTVATIAITDATQIMISTATLSINPTANLDEKTKYYLEIDSTCIKDASGNFFAGIAGSATWNFTTDDTIGPVVLSFSPLDDDASVALDITPTITFDEPAVAATGDIRIKKSADDTIVETIDVTDAGQITLAFGQMLIWPTSDFDNSTGYYIEIDAGAVEDSSSNAFLGITDATTWNFVTTAVPPPAPPLPGHYVSPTGDTATADGTVGKPWTLAQLAAHPAAVLPGDTVWLRAGTYRPFSANNYFDIVGTAANRINIQSYPTETAKLDIWDLSAGVGPDNLKWRIRGSYTDYRDLEFLNTNTTTRYTLNINNAQGQIDIGRGDIRISGSYIKMINNVCHDMNQAFDFQDGATGGELHGNIIYNNGWDTTKNQWDHAIYTQNDGTAVKSYINNIGFNQFGYGMHAYGGVGSPLKKMTMQGNVFFQNSYAPGGTAGWGDVGDTRGPGYFLRDNFLVGGKQPIDDLIVEDNCCYSSNNDNRERIGSQAPNTPNQTATINRNYFASGRTFLRSFAFLTAADNETIAHDDTAGDGDFSSWAIIDRTGTRIFTRGNDYETGRGHIVVYNWNGNPSAVIPAAAIAVILTTGDVYAIYHVYDLDTTVATGTWTTGTDITLTMASKLPQVILGDISDLGSPIAMPIEFAVFLVLKTA